MPVRNKLAENFKEIQGGLFSKVSKADVGTALNELIANGAALMCWADPFFPDPAIPEHVKEATIKGIMEGTSAHYTMPIGNMELKIEIVKKLEKFNKFKNINPERNIIITPGSDAGLLFAMMPFINPGDEVMVPDPSYPSNFLNPKLLGGVTVSVPLDVENNYQINIEEFEKRVTPKTKMILITNPNNPTTTVLRRESLEKLAEFAIKHDLIVVSDQAFEDSVYDDIEFVSIATLPGMWERTITVCSISKGMALSGYRVAYIVADDHIMDVYYGCAVNVIGATNTASQLGAIAAMKDNKFLQEYNEIFEKRRKKVYELFNSIPGVSMKMPECSFMSWVNISKLGTSSEVYQYIIKEANVIVNEGTPYGKQGEGYLRVIHGAYKDEDKLMEALNRVKIALTKLAKEKGIVK